MKNNCELCGGKYDFRMVQINEYLNMTGIAFSGSKRQVNNNNRFRFCPKCGRELTKEDFGGADFDDKPTREKIDRLKRNRKEIAMNLSENTDYYSFLQGFDYVIDKLS
jgi:hypothetical protein